MIRHYIQCIIYLFIAASIAIQVDEYGIQLMYSHKLLAAIVIMTTGLSLTHAILWCVTTYEDLMKTGKL